MNNIKVDCSAMRVIAINTVRDIKRTIWNICHVTNQGSLVLKQIQFGFGHLNYMNSHHAHLYKIKSLVIKAEKKSNTCITVCDWVYE